MSDTVPSREQSEDYGSIESVENIEEFVYKEEIACTTTSSLRKE
jgi:hypothetical protein